MTYRIPGSDDGKGTAILEDGILAGNWLPILDRMAKLERAIAAMVNGEFDLMKDIHGQIVYCLAPDLDQSSTCYPSPAAAALAGLDAMDELAKEAGK